MYREKIYSAYVSSGYGTLNINRDMDRSSSAYSLNFGPLLPKDKSAAILEIGCGMGHFQDFMKRYGYNNRVAVDIGPEQIDFCKRIHEGEFILVEDTNVYLSENKQRFDLIVMNDVLEHFKKNETIEILDNIQKALKNGGRLIMRTPNMAALFAGASRYGDFTHETGFTERSANQLLKAVGFSMVQCIGEKNYIRSTPKRLLFNFLSSLRSSILRALVFIERPGDRYPEIFSKNLIIIADLEADS